MFGTMGFSELIIILVIVLIIFGAGKLPQIGEGVGKALKGFKKEVHDIPPAETATAAAEPASAAPPPSTPPTSTPPAAAPSTSPKGACVRVIEKWILVVENVGVQPVTVEHPRRDAEEDPLVARDVRIPPQQDEQEPEAEREHRNSDRPSAHDGGR